jgi:hypothetical protein
MTQRAVRIIFAVGFCTATLPGCAQFGGSLFSSSKRPPDLVDSPDPAAVANRSGRPAVTEDAATADAKSAASDAPFPFTTVSDGTPKLVTLPKGHRVPEYLSPPQVLAPPDMETPMQASSADGIVDGQSPLQPLPPIPGQPMDNTDPVVWALQCLLKKQPAEALEHLKQFDSKTQEAILRLLMAIDVLHDKSIEKLDPKEIAALGQNIEGLRNELASRCELMINRMCLCEKVIGNQPLVLPKTHVMHAEERVTVFVEVRNTACRPEGDKYVTLLHGTATIYNAAGEREWQQNFRPWENPNEFPVRRSDCTQCYVFYAPKGMRPGKYTLTMQIVDETLVPHRIVERSVEFTCGPP